MIMGAANHPAWRSIALSYHHLLVVLVLEYCRAAFFVFLFSVALWPRLQDEKCPGGSSHREQQNGNYRNIVVPIISLSAQSVRASPDPGTASTRTEDMLHKQISTYQTAKTCQFSRQCRNKLYHAQCSVLVVGFRS